MSDRVREPGEGLIVAFPTEGNTITTSTREEIGVLNGYFFRVAKSQRYYYEYDQLGPLANGGSKDFGFLGENNHESDGSPGSDIFRLQTDDFYMYHVGVGLETPELRTYYKLGPSQPFRPTDHENRGEPDPTAPSQFGYYTGAQIQDRYDPPAFTERVAIRNDREGEFLQWGFHAEDQLTTEETTLHFTGRFYELIPVLDEETQDKMLMSAVENVDDPDIPTVMTTPGGVFTYRLGSTLPDAWDDLKNEGLRRPLEFGKTSGGN